jgi:YegS/Rv2252/BmrU family lipid kinase
MKKKILFIINPISGSGKYKIVEKSIARKLNRNVYDYDLVYTKAAKHAIELSKQAAKEGFHVVVAVGGDGSVNEVGRSLVNTHSALAILPCGSGNGTARHMKIPMNLGKAMEVINRNKVKSIDTFSVNEEIGINAAGIGYAAYVAHEFSKLKRRGFNNYLKIAIRNAWKYKPQLCEIEIGGHNKKLNAFIIDIANGCQWGNNAVIAPHAKNDDGLLDMVLITHFPFHNFPTMAIRLFTRSIHRSKYVKIERITKAVIRQERNYAHIDGEPLIIGNELRVKINPISLKVVVP